MRRQRRPAAEFVRGAPADPGWPPDAVGHPDPAVMFVAEPAAIVERRPAPGIVGNPIPSGIRPDPMTGVAIRPPVMVQDDNSRLPAPTVTGQVHPGAIGGKVFIEIGHFRRRSADIDRGGRDDRRGRSGHIDSGGRRCDHNDRSRGRSRRRRSARRRFDRRRGWRSNRNRRGSGSWRWGDWRRDSSGIRSLVVNVGLLRTSGSVVVEHRRDDDGRHPHIPEIKHMVRGEVETLAGILDISQQHLVAGAGGCQPDHVTRSGGQRARRRGQCRRRAGWRWRFCATADELERHCTGQPEPSHCFHKFFNFVRC